MVSYGYILEEDIIKLKKDNEWVRFFLGYEEGTTSVSLYNSDFIFRREIGEIWVCKVSLGD